jgi:hypothetical protein
VKFDERGTVEYRMLIGVVVVAAAAVAAAVGSKIPQLMWILRWWVAPSFVVHHAGLAGTFVAASVADFEFAVVMVVEIGVRI